MYPKNKIKRIRMYQYVLCIARIINTIAFHAVLQSFGMEVHGISEKISGDVVHESGLNGVT
jgi:hypothetical protein